MTGIGVTAAGMVLDDLEQYLATQAPAATSPVFDLIAADFTCLLRSAARD